MILVFLACSSGFFNHAVHSGMPSPVRAEIIRNGAVELMRSRSFRTESSEMSKTFKRSILSSKMTSAGWTEDVPHVLDEKVFDLVERHSVEAIHYLAR